MKKLFTSLLKSIGFILGLLVIYILLAIVLPLIPVNKTTSSNEDSIVIYILTNGMHTDIVMPVESEVINWSEIIPFRDTKAKQPMKYIAMGWGDKGFYLDTPEWKDLKFSTAFNAAFWLGDSAMHTTFYNQINESEECRKISISKEEYESLVNYLKNSFDYDANGKVQLIPTDMVYGNNDAFYEAKGNYSFLFTCNTWAADALKEAKQTAPLWTAAQQGIFYHY
ncbi:TIGR02117 family protein [Faecalibacter rhinopitheci]|uniref:TIGR02117 family protein n=1 Tax=Faecalibacter rhinopitheci TaxID=2779678 RepID=A0A8J7FWF4_9FLAO|nr:TIGR02117 family protein [Faecalibacter rhinopitheci]MBF0597836.1 TIGR02117 family protein [Faecalibacter rhinopitheci]